MEKECLKGNCEKEFDEDYEFDKWEEEKPVENKADELANKYNIDVKIVKKIIEEVKGE